MGCCLVRTHSLVLRRLGGFLSLAADASAKQSLVGASCLSQLYLYKGLSRPREGRERPGGGAAAVEAEAAPPPPHQPLRRPGCKPGDFSILPSHTSLTPESLQPTAFIRSLEKENQIHSELLNDSFRCLLRDKRIFDI